MVTFFFFFCDIAQLSFISGGLRSSSVRGIFSCAFRSSFWCAPSFGEHSSLCLAIAILPMALKVGIVSGNLGVGTTIQGDDRANLGLCLWCLSWTCLRPGRDLHFGQATWLHEYVACNVRFRGKLYHCIASAYSANHAPAVIAIYHFLMRRRFISLPAEFRR